MARRQGHQVEHVDHTARVGWWSAENGCETAQIPTSRRPPTRWVFGWWTAENGCETALKTTKNVEVAAYIPKSATLIELLSPTSTFRAAMSACLNTLKWA